MDRVVIGMDSHMASVTIEARDTREVLRARGRFGTDKRNYAQMLRTARQWPDRLWAVEGANGIGRPIAQRLLADGERVLDVPAVGVRPHVLLRVRPDVGGSSASPSGSRPRARSPFGSSTAK